jgi:hypothetical protein
MLNQGPLAIHEQLEGRRLEIANHVVLARIN